MSAADVVVGGRNRTRGGCMILQDIPPGSAITLDGVTRVTPPSSLSALSSSAFDNRGLWIIDDIPSSSSSQHVSLDKLISDRKDSSSSVNDFHLLVVRPGTPAAKSHNNGNSNEDGGGFRRALPIGFILSSSLSSASSSSLLSTTAASDFGYDWVFARKYDRYTEELSQEENVDSLTLHNILLAMMGDDDSEGSSGGELKRIAIPYERFMMMNSSTYPMSTASYSPSSSSSSMGWDDIGGTNKQQHSSLPSWETRTSMIHSHFLQQCHKLMHGCKIVPSSYGINEHHNEDDSNNKNNDGISISYPPIPCIDPTIDAHRLIQHTGTRTYLSTLSPTERTRLLMFTNHESNADNSSMMDDAESCRRPDSTGEHVWKDVLCRYYGNECKFYNGGRISESEHHFLADIELSFLLVLYLECQSSLEFWRDAISMCSISITPTASSSSSSSSSNLASRHPLFFHKLLSILYIQLSCIESEFFGDVEYSSGNTNFCVVALARLCDACDGVERRRKRNDDEEGGENNNDIFENLKVASRQLRLLARDKFGLDLSSSTTTKDGEEEVEDDDAEMDALWSSTGVDFADDSEDIDKIETRNNLDIDESNGDDDDEGPVVIPYDEIEASLARTSTVPTTSHAPMQCNDDEDFNSMDKAQSFSGHHRKDYPLLYAAMQYTGEDEVMACARILDEKNDVSLVREAAAYLEGVEAHYRDGESSK
ncbi:hypothetical protein ACHAWU_002645 [Discostella pseudostelligera]|uniref:AAR2 C-terminal domain-containing protein n=1 Tax=Discostella pseudostelligera TaxID=259834 RepID=A0ABD3M1W2_9STRA